MLYKFKDLVSLCYETDCAFSHDKKLLELNYSSSTNELTAYDKSTMDTLYTVQEEDNVYVDLLSNPTMIRVGLKKKEKDSKVFSMLLIGYDVVNKFKEIESAKSIIIVPK